MRSGCGSWAGEEENRVQGLLWSTPPRRERFRGQEFDSLLRLHVPAVTALNDDLLARAETAALLPRQRIRALDVLANALHKLGPSDVLLLDRGYPAVWLVNLLQLRGVRFIMRCDTSSRGWTALRRFIQGSAPEAHIMLSAPQPQDAADWQCSPQVPTVRVVRQIAPNGQTRVRRPTGRATWPTR